MTTDPSPRPHSQPETGPRASIGVDLGGTGTRVLALDPDGSILHQASFPTARQAPPDPVGRLLAAISTAAEAVRASTGAEASGVGIGASGPMTADGIIDNPATLPAFTGLDLCAAVRDTLGLSCVIENDAAAAAIGEHTHGAGHGSRTSVTVTLGTGIGVAVVTDGRLVRAGDGSHPEAGHIAVPDAPTPCYCGLPSCWEQAASRTALEAMTGSDPTSAADAARRGDAQAARTFEHYGRQVAAGLGTLLTLFRPDRVVLGGSGARYLDLYAHALQAGIERNAPYRWTPPVLPARLGDLAGAVGAAVLARTGD
ncbi:MAG TPA: ROK family protein [Actinocrinis sp.]|nr:ROK family protein [Actinocrinis sp.]